MDFSFDFIIDVMASFYDFFMGISILLTYSVGEITIGMAIGDGVFTWSWFNPFSQVTSSNSIRNSALLEALRTVFEPLGFYNIPIWQALLSGAVSFFFLGILLNLLKSVIDAFT